MNERRQGAAMSLADELWDKYGDGMRHSKKEFTAAITEAMQAVRKRDAELCRNLGRPVGAGDGDTYVPGTSAACAAAIEREPLP